MPRIVIIEEDKPMRDLLMEWLSVAGYYAYAAAPGLPKGTDNPHLAIVDVFMPRHLGALKLCAVKASYPGTPLIAISGQFQAGIVGSPTAAAALGVRQVIAKPFTRGDLLAAVSGVIGPAH